MLEHDTEQGRCACGCGGVPNIIQVNDAVAGLVRGQYRRYIIGHTMRRNVEIRWSKSTPEQRFWARVDKNGPIPESSPELGPCWVWRGTTLRGGHGQIRWRGRNTLTHRLVWTLLRGPIPEGAICCHHCDNPPCVNPDHLFLGTNAGNAGDMVRKGRSAKGERISHAKLSASDVQAIRSRYAAGDCTQRQIAADYGVTHSVIGLIARGETWRHIPS